MAKSITKIQTEQPELNRIQDHIIGTLNPVLRKLTGQQALTGSTGGNTALQNLIKLLAQAGIIKDQTT